MNKEKIITLIKKNEFWVAQAQVNVFICDFYFSSCVSQSFINQPIGPILVYLKGKEGYQFSQKGQFEAVLLEFYQRFKKGEGTLLEKKYRKTAKEMEEIWPGDEVIKKYDLKELTFFFRKFLPVAGKNTELEVIGEDKGSILEKLIVPKMAQRHGWKISSTLQIINSLAHPLKPMVFNREKEAFLELGELVKKNRIRNFQELGKNPALKKAFNQYLKNFFWIRSNFYQAVPITLPTLLKKLRQEFANWTLQEIKKEKEKNKDNWEEIRKEAEIISKKVNLSKEDQEDLVFAQNFIQFLDDRKMIMMKKIYRMNFLMIELGRRWGIPYEQALSLTVSEVEKTLKGKRLNLKKIKKRNQGAFLVFERGHLPKIFLGKTAEKIGEFCLENRRKTSILKGRVASRGGRIKLRGRVKVMTVPDSKNFRKGDILVTSMTRVEFMPLMRLSRAIITDEGGIACHAAIISRELGIPCIIGTQNATEVLKDKDEVMMNLQTGRIKLIREEASKKKK